MGHMSRRDALHLIDSKDVRDRDDAVALMDLMADLTGEVPYVAGNAIGFGSYHYRYETGREGDFFNIGFAPTKQGLTIYVMSGLKGFDDILDRLGPHTTTKSTVKITRLADIDQDALSELVSECVRHLEEVENSLGAVPRMSNIPPRMPTEM